MLEAAHQLWVAERWYLSLRYRRVRLVNSNRSDLSAAIAACALLLAAYGCEKELPAQTRAAMAKAQSDGAMDVNKVISDANEKMADDRRDGTKTQQDVAHDGAVGTWNVTVMRAEVAHNVAIKRCGAQAGDARDICTKQADTEFDAAKRHADATKPVSDPAT
jgi:hypothetical protein